MELGFKVIKTTDGRFVDYVFKVDFAELSHHILPGNMVTLLFHPSKSGASFKTRNYTCAMQCMPYQYCVWPRTHEHINEHSDHVDETHVNDEFVDGILDEYINGSDENEEV